MCRPAPAAGASSIGGCNVDGCDMTHVGQLTRPTIVNVLVNAVTVRRTMVVYPQEQLADLYAPDRQDQLDG